MTRPKRLGVVMDPIGAITYAKDSTLAMLLAAQARGFTLSYLELGDLALRDGVALGRMRPLTVRADSANWFTLGAPAPGALSELDCLLMRKDPPFDTEYIYSTYILERAEEAGVLVVNRPQGLRDMNEKVYTAWFPQCCAPTLISRDMADLGAFLREHGKIVVKPLDGMGGRSIFVIGHRPLDDILTRRTRYVISDARCFRPRPVVAVWTAPGPLSPLVASRSLVAEAKSLRAPKAREAKASRAFVVSGPATSTRSTRLRHETR